MGSPINIITLNKFSTLSLYVGFTHIYDSNGWRRTGHKCGTVVGQRSGRREENAERNDVIIFWI